MGTSTPATFVDLDESWQAQVDELIISRNFTRFLYAVFVVVLSFICVLKAPMGGGGLQASLTLTQRLAVADHNSTASPDGTNRSSRGQQFAPIRLSRMPIPVNSSIRLRYGKLARLYLNAFRGGIRREDYMRVFMREDMCEGCFLVQVKDGKVYVHDPRGVRMLMAEFRELRMREALHWIRGAVGRGVVDNFEMVVSTTDGVVSTAREHEYRMVEAEQGRPVPVFTVVRCNVSDNIPFPMVLADVVRRGAEGNKTEDGFLRRWEDVARGMGEVGGAAVAWEEKIEKAVFRGKMRVSSAEKNVSLKDETCERVGRSGLWHRAKEHEVRLRRYDWMEGKRRRVWPFPVRWFVRRTEPVLDVKVEGKCGARIYVSDGMGMSKQNGFKYVIHAEGNSFWADRLVLQLFGGSCVIKQSAPCGMFFEPLLRAYRHYVPVDFWFKGLAVQTMWARSNDEKVRGIVKTARRFAGDYLSRAGVQTFVDELLVRYVRLVEDREIKLEKGAVQVSP